MPKNIWVILLVFPEFPILTEFFFQKKNLKKKELIYLQI
jgi:hypothetical protein